MEDCSFYTSGLKKERGHGGHPHPTFIHTSPSDNQDGVVRITSIFLSGGRWEGGHAPFPSVMAKPILLLKGKQASYGLLVLRQRGAMVATLIPLSSTLLLLITRMVWSGSPPSAVQRGGGKVVMPPFPSAMAKPILLLKGRRQAS